VPKWVVCRDAYRRDRKDEAQRTLKKIGCSVEICRPYSAVRAGGVVRASPRRDGGTGDEGGHFADTPSLADDASNWRDIVSYRKGLKEVRALSALR